MAGMYSPQTKETLGWLSWFSVGADAAQLGLSLACQQKDCPVYEEDTGGTALATAGILVPGPNIASKGDEVAEAGAVVGFDPEFALGQMTQGVGPRRRNLISSDNTRVGRATRRQTARSSTSIKTALSESLSNAEARMLPAAEIRTSRCASGNRMGPYGNEVKRKSIENHMPTVWDR